MYYYISYSPVINDQTKVGHVEKSNHKKIMSTDF